MVCGIVYVDPAVAVLPRRFCVRTVNGPASNECSCWPRRISHPLGLTPLPASDSDEGRHRGATRLLRRWRLDRAGAKVTTTQHRLHLASLRATDAAPLQPTIVRCGSVPPCRHASSTRDVAGAATKKPRARSSGCMLTRDAPGGGLLLLPVQRALVVIAPEHAQSYLEASIRAVTAAVRLDRGVIPARVPCAGRAQRSSPPLPHATPDRGLSAFATRWLETARI